MTVEREQLVIGVRYFGDELGDEEVASLHRRQVAHHRCLGGVAQLVPDVEFPPRRQLDAMTLQMFGHALARQDLVGCVAGALARVLADLLDPGPDTEVDEWQVLTAPRQDLALCHDEFLTHDVELLVVRQRLVDQGDEFGVFEELLHQQTRRTLGIARLGVALGNAAIDLPRRGVAEHRGASSCGEHQHRRHRQSEPGITHDRRSPDGPEFRRISA